MVWGWMMGTSTELILACTAGAHQGRLPNTKHNFPTIYYLTTTLHLQAQAGSRKT